MKEWILSVLVGLVVVCMLVLAYWPRESATNPSSLPVGATDIHDLGNGYSVFTLRVDGRDHRILFRDQRLGNNNRYGFCELK